MFYLFIHPLMDIGVISTFWLSEESNVSMESDTTMKVLCMFLWGLMFVFSWLYTQGWNC